MWLKIINLKVMKINVRKLTFIFFITNIVIKFGYDIMRICINIKGKNRWKI